MRTRLTMASATGQNLGKPKLHLDFSIVEIAPSEQPGRPHFLVKVLKKESLLFLCNFTIRRKLCNQLVRFWTSTYRMGHPVKFYFGMLPSGRQ